MGLQHSLGMWTRGLFSILLDYLFFGPLPSMPCPHTHRGSRYSGVADMGLFPSSPKSRCASHWGLCACLAGRGCWLIPIPEHGAVSKAVLSPRAALWYWFGTVAQTRYSCSQQQGPQILCDWCASWHFPSPDTCTMACRSRLARLASTVLVRTLTTF